MRFFRIKINYIYKIFRKNNLLNYQIFRKTRLFVVIFFCLLSPFFVFAYNTANYENKELIPGQQKTSDIIIYLNSLYNFSIAIAAILAIFMIAVGAFSYIFTSAGNASKMIDAKSKIFNAIVGLVLVMVSFLILFVINPDLVKGTIMGPGQVIEEIVNQDSSPTPKLPPIPPDPENDLLPPSNGSLQPNNAEIGTDDNKVVLSWESVSAAEKYAIRVDNEELVADVKQDSKIGFIENLKNIIEVKFLGIPAFAADGNLCNYKICDDEVTGTTYEIEVEVGKKYYWWIHSIKGDFWSEESEASFTVKEYNHEDTTLPVVSLFDVQPRTTTESVTASWEVSDNIGLSKVELWRAPDFNGTVSDWAKVQEKSISGNSVKGDFTDSPSLGNWWYGVHVIDQSGNTGTEKDQIKIVVNSDDSVDLDYYCTKSNEFVADCNSCECASGKGCIDNQCIYLPEEINDNLKCNISGSNRLSVNELAGIKGSDVTSVVGMSSEIAGIGSRFQLVNNDYPTSYVDILETRSGAGAAWQNSSLIYTEDAGIIVNNQSAGNSVGYQWGFGNYLSSDGQSIQSKQWDPIWSDHIHDVPKSGTSPCLDTGYQFDVGKPDIFGYKVSTSYGDAIAWVYTYTYKSQVDQYWSNWAVEQALYLDRGVARDSNLRLYLVSNSSKQGPLYIYDTFSIPGAICEQYTNGSYCNAGAYDYAVLVWNVYGLDIGVAIPNLKYGTSVVLEKKPYCSDVNNDLCGNISFHTWAARENNFSFPKDSIKSVSTSYYVGTLDQLEDLGYSIK